jgi:hypothetical protein
LSTRERGFTLATSQRGELFNSFVSGKTPLISDDTRGELESHCSSLSDSAKPQLESAKRPVTDDLEGDVGANGCNEGAVRVSFAVPVADVTVGSLASGYGFGQGGNAAGWRASA